MRSARILAVVLALALAAACSDAPGGGSEVPIPTGAPEPAGGGPEPPGSSGGEEPGGGGYETATDAGQAGQGVACPPCDATFACSIGDDPGVSTLVLATVNGQCVDIDSSAIEVFDCQGQVTSGGSVVATWVSPGRGMLTIITPGVTFTCSVTDGGI